MKRASNDDENNTNNTNKITLFFTPLRSLSSAWIVCFHSALQINDSIYYKTFSYFHFVASATMRMFVFLFVACAHCSLFTVQCVCVFYEWILIASKWFDGKNLVRIECIAYKTLLKYTNICTYQRVCVCLYLYNIHPWNNPTLFHRFSLIIHPRMHNTPGKNFNCMCQILSLSVWFISCGIFRAGACIACLACIYKWMQMYLNKV